MNYEKIYNQLINKRQLNILSKRTCYCEKHHIIPKCFSKNNKKENLIYLTTREHYIAHKLLEKIYKQKYGENSIQHQKMICALWRFIYSNEYQAFITSKEYEKLKSKFGKMQSVRVSGTKNGMHGRKGKLSPMYGHKCFEYMTEEQIKEWKLKQSLSHKGKTPWKGKHHTIETCKKISDLRKQNGLSKGKNNPMYGHAVTEFMSNNEIIQWKENLSKASKGRVHMYHPQTLKNICAKIEDVQKYLEAGYIYGHKYSKKQ